MKLFTRLYRLNLLATLVIFALSSCVYYLLIRYIIIDQFDSSLQIERTEVERYVARHNRLPQVTGVKDQLTSFTQAAGHENSSLETVMAYDTVGRDTAEFRKLFFSIRADRQWYRAMVGKSMEGTEHLIHSVIGITIATILLILGVSSTINRLLLRKLWQPFYHGLQLMKEYQVGKKANFNFSRSNTEEFEFMNTVLQQATNKADREYMLLKEFTENASHEMQTPLAIIRSKMDLVIQDEKVSEKHGNNLQAMYQAIDQLADLNYSLLLLTKIGNKQFAETASVELGKAVQDKALQFEEIIAARDIKTTLHIEPTYIEMNEALLETMLNNLYSNAVKHNHHGGSIDVTVGKQGTLKISNTSITKALDQNRIFSRFYKAGTSSQTGLGLSITKEICLVSGCEIKYQYENGYHSFIIEWQ